MRIAYKDAQVRDAVGERVQTKTQSKSNNTSRPPSSKICTKPWNEPGEAGFRSEFGGEREEDARAQQMTEPEGEGRERTGRGTFAQNCDRARRRRSTRDRARGARPRAVDVRSRSGREGRPREARPERARGAPPRGLGAGWGDTTARARLERAKSDGEGPGATAGGGGLRGRSVWRDGAAGVAKHL